MPKRDDAYMGEKRDAILDATISCITRTGLPGLSTTAICKEAGISMGALYTHFATKDEILVALAKRSAARRREKLEVKSADQLRRRLRDMVKQANTQAVQDATRIDMELLSASVTDPRIAEAFKPFRENKDLVEALLSLKQAGELRPSADPQAAAAAIEAILAGFTVLGLMGGKYRKSQSAALEMLLDTIMP